MKITLYNLVVENIKTLIDDKRKETPGNINKEIFLNYLCRLENFIFFDVLKNQLQNFSPEEKRFQYFFRKLILEANHDIRKAQYVKKSEIIEYFSDVLEKLEKYGRQLGIATETESETETETAPPPPVQTKTTVQSFANVKPLNLTDKNKKIYETIKTIETMLNDLKTLILEG